MYDGCFKRFFLISKTKYKNILINKFKKILRIYDGCLNFFSFLK